jgi:hypothetical protein
MAMETDLDDPPEGGLSMEESKQPHDFPGYFSLFCLYFRGRHARRVLPRPACEIHDASQNTR